MKNQKLNIEITPDHVSIWQDNDGKIQPVVYWHEDEWKEDPETVLPAIKNAVALFITNQIKLLEVLGWHELIIE